MFMLVYRKLPFFLVRDCKTVKILENSVLSLHEQLSFCTRQNDRKRKVTLARERQTPAGENSALSIFRPPRGGGVGKPPTERAHFSA